MLRVSPRIHVPPTEFDFSFARSSGPGGQNVNKVNSKATLRWRPGHSPSLPGDVKERFLHRHGNRLTIEGELIIHSQRYRDQGRNVADCLEKLRSMILAVAVPPKKRRPTKPTYASEQRRREAKVLHSRKKQSRRAIADD
jgi:ribosome-associated protein